MAVGQGITLFLIDGTPDGRVSCELFNWTGKGYKIPRRMIKESTARIELYKAGVYFLFGHDDDPSGLGSVYIGEGEEVLPRVNQHGNEEFWNEVVLFISKDENLNKAHIKYLEHELYTKAKEIGRYKIMNRSTPNRPSISEMEQAVMSQFMEHLQLLMGSLGYKLFEPFIKRSNTSQVIYYATATRNANAQAKYSNDGMVVLNGSYAAHDVVPSTSPGTVKLRQSLLSDGVLEESELGLRFTQDYLFPSPSSAAAVVLGRTANGWIEWKDKHGNTLKDNESSESIPQENSNDTQA